MHTTVSDGSDTPRALLEILRDNGFSVFSVTDHDSAKAAGTILPLLTGDDPFFIPGAEFSCKDEQGKYHILGYGFDVNGNSIRGLVELGHSLRMKKFRARLDFLKTEFGFAFPQEEVDGLLALNNPGKPHLGNLMVKYGYAETKEQAIHDFIDRVHFTTEYLRPEQAIEGILGSGGVPVLAHPFYGNGDQLILGESMDARTARLVDFGLQGLEAFYSGFSQKLCARALELADRYDLVVTAGSDYHGTNKIVRLGDTGLANGAALPERLARFLERVGFRPE